MNPKHLSSTHNINNAAIFLTGFGKFGSHDVDPTEELIKTITPQQCKKFGIQSTAILDVSCKKVDEWIQKIKPQVDKISQSKPVWFVHMGAGNNTVYHLEQSAYNNKDFLNADKDGYYCRNEPICQILKIDQSIKCKTDLSVICKELKPSHKMLVSQDPGRYLCNYLYFRSLKDLSSDNPRINSVFIHFPSSQFTNTEQNREFIFDFISWLHKSTICKE